MPFENHGNRAFTETSIRKNAPAASGVYGLSNAREWIYVGESANLQGSLLGTLRDWDPALDRTPTGFTYELCRPADRIARQNRLALELEPVHKGRLGVMRGAGE
jgi:hypothetical protein